MSVVRRAGRRRWLAASGAVVFLCALPSLIAARPVGGSAVSATELRARMLASTGVAYEGYLESRGSLALPDLPRLDDVLALLGGTTRMRAWYAGAERWRVDVVDASGERGLYRIPGGTVSWDFERSLRVEVRGEPAARLPRPADLLPPELARRVLADSAADDRLVRLPSRRVAGIDAAGLRLIPTDQATTVAFVDVWADPVSGLPVQVEGTAKGAGRPMVLSRFLDLRLRRPADAVLTPPDPPGAGRATVDAPDIANTLSNALWYPLPDRLIGRDRSRLPDDLNGVGAYGRGLSAFVVLPLAGRLGARTYFSARNAGAVPVELTGGEGVHVATPLLTGLIVRAADPDITLVLAGFVTPDLLRGAAAELLAARR